MKKWLSIAVLMLLVSSPVWASPTIFGPSGLITVPTAESLRYKQFNVAYDYIVDKGSDNGQWYYKANLGTFKSWELGVVGGSAPDEGMYLNAKYYLMSDNARYPLSIAIGAENLSSDDRTGLYMVATKIFEGGFRGHLGFKAIFAEEELDPAIMGGVEYLVSDELSLLTDVLGERQQYQFNIGARYYVTPEFTLRAALLDLADSTGDGVSLSLGIAFSKYL